MEPGKRVLRVQLLGTVLRLCPKLESEVEKRKHERHASQHCPYFGFLLERKFMEVRQ